MVSAERTVKPALAFKGSLQLLEIELRRDPVQVHLHWENTTAIDLSYGSLTERLKPALEWLCSSETCAHSLNSSAWGHPEPTSLPWDDQEGTCTAPHTLGALRAPSAPSCLSLHPLAQMSNQCPNSFPIFSISLAIKLL